MGLKERIKELCKEKNISMNKLEETLGFGKGYISKLGTSNPNTSKLQKIADYFGVSLDYLMTGNSESSKSNTLSKKDERDIAKDLENIMNKLSNKENGPASFEGEDIPEADQELFAGQIELMLRRLKAINKELYNPNKNKK
ncbi:helix-turn-helix domain-containing protein [Frisingicoccus caecimuris]|uniref:Helix-turn-helix protein n=1 Tax=Frisingicoccus caecimuris TaxID=1796636 RepID=A0A4R2LQN9_9FIRM|nr:helix-turn-helix transcriptional regulator [Frisingicoccus caecimuris]MCR1918043.1 helix-turn-helix domain-containing protein [Frisingicoccus caecimuris]TCO86406.1 helix-turn-helix protein [Frisingicoccus caecimuris]